MTQFLPTDFMLANTIHSYYGLERRMMASRKCMPSCETRAREVLSSTPTALVVPHKSG